MGQTGSIIDLQDKMELPYGEGYMLLNKPEADSHVVKVRLNSHGKQAGDDRSFMLSKSNSSIKVGRASSSTNHATSSQLENCYISSPIMSRHHAKFVFGDKGIPLKIVDEGSTHGTFVNMVKLNKGREMELENRSIITFGTEVLNGRCRYIPYQEGLTSS